MIGVLTLESSRLNGFTENHLNFARSLTGRAGVAVDNARLFTETSREREKLALILRNITDTVIVVDVDGRIIILNHSAALALRLSPEQEYTGHRFGEIVQDVELLRLYQQARSQREDIVKGEVRLPNDRVYHAMLNRHRQIGWIIVLQDITHFKEMDQLKSELVATVSHDLKQPLSVMRGYLDLLQMVNTFDERSTRYMESLDHAFLTMRQLIDDLLNMAQIESGLALHVQPVDLHRLLVTCVDQLQQPAQSKALSVQMNVTPEIPPVSGDEARLMQIFSNLVGNAIKYTQPEGWVRIFAKYDEAHLTIYIQDNGLGIGPEDQEHIFERFYRVRRPETESIDGTGLGLAIVKSLVEAHRGTIQLQSAIGKGSIFSVTLPLHTARFNADRPD
ncbi:MAG: ATP-binding protein [Anaerolineae bacterium]|nr:ATP-binding protein [Anaerolineae bacterium]